MQKPEWWDWPFDCGRQHVWRRMRDRNFNEVELRDMLELATEWEPDTYEGRFLIAVEHHGVLWHIIVEPDAVTKTVVVITAFRPKVDT